MMSAQTIASARQGSRVGAARDQRKRHVEPACQISLRANTRLEKGRHPRPSSLNSFQKVTLK